MRHARPTVDGSSPQKCATNGWSSACVWKNDARNSASSTNFDASSMGVYATVAPWRRHNRRNASSEPPTMGATTRAPDRIVFKNAAASRGGAAAGVGAAARTTRHGRCRSRVFRSPPPSSSSTWTILSPRSRLRFSPLSLARLIATTRPLASALEPLRRPAAAITSPTFGSASSSSGASYASGCRRRAAASKEDIGLRSSQARRYRWRVASAVCGLSGAVCV